MEAHVADGGVAGGVEGGDGAGGDGAGSESITAEEEEGGETGAGTREAMLKRSDEFIHMGTTDELKTLSQPPNSHRGGGSIEGFVEVMKQVLQTILLFLLLHSVCVTGR